MRRLVSAIALLAISAVALEAQSARRVRADSAPARTASRGSKPAAKPSMLIYPFGLASGTRGGEDISGMFAARALEGVLSEGRFRAVNNSANAAIQQQLEAAGTLAQFESAVQIRRDATLQSKYMLTGFVERVEMKEPKGKDGKKFYEATVSARIFVYDVETSQVMLSETVRVTNSAIGGVACPDGWRGVACRAGNTAANSLVQQNVGGAVGNEIKAQSALEAIEGALAKAPAEIARVIEKAIP